MDERHVSLLARAERVLANRPVAEAVGKVRAIVGIPNAPDSEKLAQAALDKLRNPILPAPTPVELAALEFVIRMMRPAPLSKAGELQRLPSTPGSTTYNPATEQAWNGFCAAIKPYLYSIGRLDRTAGSNPEIGTGFLVASDLLLTNHHVLAELSHGADALQEGQATVTFYQEYQTTDPPEDRFPIVKVVAIHPTLDLALLKIRLTSRRPALSFDTAAPDRATEVAAIGYPYQDARNPLFADAVFGRVYGVKRSALGEIMDTAPQRLLHDCSTLGGNSGSPVLSLATGRVVGVHFTGSFMYRNEAVPAMDAQAFVNAAIT